MGPEDSVIKPVNINFNLDHFMSKINCSNTSEQTNEDSRDFKNIRTVEQEATRQARGKRLK